MHCFCMGLADLIGGKYHMCRAHMGIWGDQKRAWNQFQALFGSLTSAFKLGRYLRFVEGSLDFQHIAADVGVGFNEAGDFFVTI